MRKKEKVIIDSAIKLFARKGFSSTSIQEIASDSGISKGAFYLHFKSKDDLLLSILEFIFDTIHRNVSKFDREESAPREKFIKQLTALFATFISHKEFFIMLSKEQAIPRNKEISDLIFMNHQKIHQIYQNGLILIYGESITEFSVDLSLLLEGMFRSYLILLMFDPSEMDIEKLAHFLMRRMDSIVKDISGDTPFMTEEKVNRTLQKSKAILGRPTINEIILKLRKEIETIANNEAYLISIDVLEEEIKKDQPRIPVIKGMLSNCKDVKTAGTYIKEIADYFNI